MGDVEKFPMTWAHAYRLIANEIGMSEEAFTTLVNDAMTRSEREREHWLSEQMMLAVRKKLMRDPDPAKRGLTHEEVVQACRNIGYDLTCGACAALFHTGITNHAHSETCSTGDAELKVCMAAEAWSNAEAPEPMSVVDALVDAVDAWRTSRGIQ